MSQENMNVARRIADGFEAQDFDAVRRNFDSNIEWYEDPSFPEAGVYRGIDAVAEYARQFRSEFAELRTVGLRVQGRQGDPLLLVSSPKRSPRSRRAAGVGHRNAPERQAYPIRKLARVSGRDCAALAQSSSPD